MEIGNFDRVLSKIALLAVKPALFAPGEPHFWNDQYISSQMLKAHLDPDSDKASRKHQTIDKTVDFLSSPDIMGQVTRLLDLGCGPGLYSNRFARKGIEVTGIDISSRSIEYARDYAVKNRLMADYRCLDFLDLDYHGEFDAAIQIYGELNTLADDKRDFFLTRIREALTAEGIFIFDVTTRELRLKGEIKNRWYVSEGGFWRPGRHLVLEHGFDYPEDDTWLDQYVVFDEVGTVTVYRNWFHDYTLATIKDVMEKAGFQIKQVWNDLTGAPFDAKGDWIGILARKA
jgi:SAM-dependent methyltransferase